MKYIVKEEDTLLNFLYKSITNKSKNTIKNILKNEQVVVNNKITTKFDYKLFNNDIVEIRNKINDLEIIYEDKSIIVVNKKAGIPTIADNKNKENNLYHIVSNYLKIINKNNKIFIIHRLDRDTSGLVMFAKNSHIQKLYQNNWNDLVITREYTAVIQGTLINKKDTLKHFLNENKEGYVYVDKKGKEAITCYEVLKENKDYTMLKIHLKTGRKNQIRVQMQAINHSIVGDKKYGSKINPLKRLGLHAKKLEVIDPITNKKLTFVSELPECFTKLF